MERVLVVLSGEDNDEAMLDKAAQYAAGAGAELLTVMLITEKEWKNDQEILGAIADKEHTSYENHTPEEYAKTRAETITTEGLDDRNVVFEALGTATEDSRRASTIIEIAEAQDCGHVFIHGRRRSPTGKAIFGDTTQDIILNFDGYVTVSTVSYSDQ